MDDYPAFASCGFLYAGAIKTNSGPGFAINCEPSLMLYRCLFQVMVCYSISIIVSLCRRSSFWSILV